jgi:hypothetical protein
MKLSSFVNSIVDRKIRSMTISILSVAALLRDHTTRLVKANQFQNRFARGVNNYGSWELRPGVIEMWGRFMGPAGTEQAVDFSFPLVLPNISYNLSATPIITASNAAKNLGVQIVDQQRQASSARIFYQSSTLDAAQKLDGFDWRIICAVDFDYVAAENTTTLTPGLGDASGATKIAAANSRPS